MIKYVYPFFTEDSIWYINAALGHNTLGKMMSKISEDAGLSQTYTNHCIRATCITALDQKGFEARHIMAISGHRSETSIKSYSRNVSESKKHSIFSVLSENIVPITNQQTHVHAANSTAASSSAPESVELLPLGNEEFISQLFAAMDENGTVESGKENGKVESRQVNSTSNSLQSMTLQQHNVSSLNPHISNLAAPSISNCTVNISYNFQLLKD